MTDIGGSGTRSSVRETIRAALVTGTAVIVPFVITVFVFTLLVGYIRPVLVTISQLVVGFTPIQEQLFVQVATPIALLAYILTVGFLVNSTRVGELAVYYFDEAVARIPGIGSVYDSFRQMSDVMLESETESFQEVKLVEFPHEGAYTLGFVTTETPASLSGPAGHDRMLTLFLPLAPNPVMGGHLVHMPAEKVMDVDMTVEEGIRAIVTSGVAVGGTAGGGEGLSESTLRELSAVEHADQKFTPETGSPADRRQQGQENAADRRRAWDDQVDPEDSATSRDIERRDGADAELGRADGVDPDADGQQPYSLYGQDESTVTPGEEAGRYRAEQSETEDSPAAAADRSSADRDSTETRPAAAAGRPDSDGGDGADEDGEPPDDRQATPPAERADRHREDRDGTETKPADRTRGDDSNGDTSDSSE